MPTTNKVSDFRQAYSKHAQLNYFKYTFYMSISGIKKCEEEHIVKGTNL